MIAMWAWYCQEERHCDECGCTWWAVVHGWLLEDLRDGVL